MMCSRSMRCGASLTLIANHHALHIGLTDTVVADARLQGERDIDLDMNYNRYHTRDQRGTRDNKMGNT